MTKQQPAREIGASSRSPVNWQRMLQYTYYVLSSRGIKKKKKKCKAGPGFGNMALDHRFKENHNSTTGRIPLTVSVGFLFIFLRIAGTGGREQLPAL
jgi:hypothetical protein